MFSWLKIVKKSKEETSFMKNGSILLEELIISCNGKSNHIRSFSTKELNKATNNFHHENIIFQDPYYTLYKGFIQDRPITIKRYKDDATISPSLLKSAIRDIVIGTQMSAHKNVLKLVGCSLDSQIPISVYEFVSDTTLSRQFFKNTNPLSFRSRVKIAADIAHAVSYSHVALSRSVVLRDLRPSTILLDQDNVAKITDFSLAISIPDGETHVMTDVVGKTGHAPREYVVSGCVSEKLDVFYFDILMIQLLAGDSQLMKVTGWGYISLDEYLKHCIQTQKLVQFVDSAILIDVEKQQVVNFGELALSCFCVEAEDRPTMADVAKELNPIHRSLWILP